MQTFFIYLQEYIKMFSIILDHKEDTLLTLYIYYMVGYICAKKLLKENESFLFI